MLQRVIKFNIFSEFLTAVDNGEVVKVEIQGNNIRGVLSNGNNFSTYSPSDPNLIEKLSTKGVVFQLPLLKIKCLHFSVFCFHGSQCCF